MWKRFWTGKKCIYFAICEKSGWTSPSVDIGGYTLQPS